MGSLGSITGYYSTTNSITISHGLQNPKFIMLYIQSGQMPMLTRRTNWYASYLMRGYWSTDASECFYTSSVTSYSYSQSSTGYWGAFDISYATAGDSFGGGTISNWTATHSNGVTTLTLKFTKGSYGTDRMTHFAPATYRWVAIE